MSTSVALSLNGPGTPITFLPQCNDDISLCRYIHTKSKSHLLASRHMVYMYKRNHWCVVYGLDAIVGWQGGKIKASI